MCTQLRCIKSGNPASFRENALYPVVFKMVIAGEETAEILSDVGKIKYLVKIDEHSYVDEPTATLFRTGEFHQGN